MDLKEKGFQCDNCGNAFAFFRLFRNWNDPVKCKKCHASNVITNLAKWNIYSVFAGPLVITVGILLSYLSDVNVVVRFLISFATGLAYICFIMIDFRRGMILKSR